MQRILLMSVLVGVVACPSEEPAATAARKPTDETVPARTMPAPTPSTKTTTTTTTTTMDARAQAALDMSLAMLMKDQMLLHENLRPVMANINVDVKDGVATLGGRATEAEQTMLVDVAKSIRGITRVDNRLEGATPGAMPNN